MNRTPEYLAQRVAYQRELLSLALRDMVRTGNKDAAYAVQGLEKSLANAVFIQELYQDFPAEEP